MPLMMMLIYMCLCTVQGDGYIKIAFRVKVKRNYQMTDTAQFCLNLFRNDFLLTLVRFSNL